LSLLTESIHIKIVGKVANNIYFCWFGFVIVCTVYTHTVIGGGVNSCHALA